MVVLLPVYNEEAVILASLAAVAKEAAAEPSIRFTFVDDGSTDRTVDVLRTGLESLPPATAGRITLMPLGANAGKGAALRAAVLRCAPTTPVICFMDGDLAYDPSHARRLMEAMLRANAPIAIGSRRESPKELRNTRRLRRILGQGFNRVVRIGLGLPFRDTQAGVKAFTSEAAISIFSRSRLDGFAFDAELLYTAKLHNLAVVEVPARVNRAHRRKPTKVNLVSDSLRMLRDIARIRWNHLRGRYR
jgi:glycosyltransferase involved in cell wall biosynthesis